MNKWDGLYSVGSINEKPSEELVRIIPLLKSQDIREVLDAGCGTGRHTLYLANEGFSVNGIDISQKAIEIAKSQGPQTTNYVIGSLENLPYSQDSMDFILVNHSLEYNTKDGIEKTVRELTRVLKPNHPILVRVVSTKHQFNGVRADQVTGFSHIGFCVRNNMPIHFFEDKELANLFRDYKIVRLEHLTHSVNHPRIDIPLTEWVLFGYKI